MPLKVLLHKALLAVALALPPLLSPNPAEAVIDVKSAIDEEGRLFSIEVRDADIRDVLNALAQQTEINIITGEDVEGKVSMSFKEITFKDALEMVIKANGLAYTIQNNVLWVGKDVDLSEDISTEIVRLNYAEPVRAAAQVEGLLSEHGKAYADERTSSVILRDLPGNIARARGLMKAMDTRTDQVTIEARIVEATSTFSRDIGVQWGGSYASNNTFTGGHLLPESPGNRNFAVNLPAPTPTSGLGIVLGSLSRKLLLDLELSAAESKGELRIVSRPKITTVNNKPATIHSGLTFRVKLSQSVLTSEQAATTTTSTSGALSGIEEIKTGIDLTVTPKVTSDGYILLTIDTNKSDPDFTHQVDGIPGVTEKSATTSVLIKDGDTVVIGGLYKTRTDDQDGAVPFLARVPVLGFFFRHYSRSRNNEELLVFLTPRIVKYNTSSAEIPEVIN